MPWVKGQSGNPKGRAKEPVTIAFKAAKHGREAIAELVELMRSSSDDKVRFKAAFAILDLGHGKPQQYVEPQEREPLRTIALATLEEWASILRQAGLLLPSTDYLSSFSLLLPIYPELFVWKASCLPYMKH